MKITLSIEDRDLILRYAVPSDKLEATLRLGLREGKLLTFDFDWYDAEDLAECLVAEANHAKSRKLRRQFERLSDRIEDTLEKQVSHSAEATPDRPRAMPPEVRKAIEEVMASEEFTTPDEINSELAKLSRAHNTRPREEFQGLSPEQMIRLLYREWDSPDSGMQCREDLTLDEADTAEIFHNARVFLTALQHEKGVKATAVAGNLNRKFVLAMVETMRWPEGYTEELWFFNKVLNEEDVDHLHVLRIVLDIAGLIRRRKGRFLITKKGSTLLGEAKAGVLYTTLFRAYFTEFNLGYSDRIEEYPEVQQTIRYSLYVLGKAAHKWRSPEELAPIVFLPAVAQGFHDRSYNDTAELLLQIRLVRPLERFGLLECEREKGAHITFAFIKSIRTTPLYDRFLQFTLSN